MLHTSPWVLPMPQDPRLLADVLSLSLQPSPAQPTESALAADLHSLSTVKLTLLLYYVLFTRASAHLLRSFSSVSFSIAELRRDRHHVCFTTWLMPEAQSELGEHLEG